jgi:arylsulfatase A-like enzyme
MSRLVLLLLLFAAGIQPTVQAWAADRPNVLFISIDDLNDWVGFLGGHPQVKTPNMDRLANRGVVFTDAHCAAPICGPSRSAVMTGRQPYRTGLYTNAANVKALAAVMKRDPSIQTLPAYFRMNGYRTLGAGKLFHGGVPRDTFDEYGPDHSSGGRSGGPFKDLSSAAQNPSHLVNQDGLKLMLPLNQMPDDRPWGSSNTFDWGPVDLPEDRFSDGKVTNWAIAQLKSLAKEKKDASSPFFLGVGFFRPHQPLFNPQKYHDMYPPESVTLPPMTPDDDLSDVPPVGRQYALRAATSGTHATVEKYGQWRNAVSSYLASVSFVDALIGRILDQLDSGPFADNTLIVLWSDHGFHLGEKQHWGKATGWQRATRVPLGIVPSKNSSIAGFQSGSRCDRPVNLIDLYPTLVEACALPKRSDLDGQSLLPLVADPKAQPQRSTVTTWARGNHSLYTSDLHVMHYFDGTREVYDRRRDPHEWTNIAEKHGIGRLQTLLPANDDIRLFVRMGPWKAVFPKAGSPLGSRPLLFETGFENQIEERTSESGRFPHILQQIQAHLASVELASKYVTIPDLPLIELKARLTRAQVPFEELTDWHRMRPSMGLAYKGSSAVYIKLQSADGNELRMPRLNNPVTKVYLAADAQRSALNIRPLPTEWVISLPGNRPDQDVVVLETIDEPHLPTVPQTIEPSPDGSYELKAHQALVYGEKLCYEPLPHKNTIGYWVEESAWAQWHLRIDEPGTFEVEILQGCGKGQGGSQVSVDLSPAYPTVDEYENPPATAGTQFTVEDTGHFQNFKWRTIGRLSATRTGWFILRIKPVKKAKNAVMDVRAMRLRR